MRRRRFGRPSRATGLALLAGMMVTGGLPPHAWTGLLVPAGLALLMALVLASPRPARLAWFFALAHQSTLLYWLFLLDPAKSIPTRALVPIQAGPPPCCRRRCRSDRQPGGDGKVRGW